MKSFIRSLKGQYGTKCIVTGAILLIKISTPKIVWALGGSFDTWKGIWGKQECPILNFLRSL